MSAWHDSAAETPLRTLARTAGVAVEWTDAFGHPQRVPERTLEQVLSALGLACGTGQEIAEALARLRAPRPLPPLLTVDAGQEAVLPGLGPAMEAVLELDMPHRLPLRPHPRGAAFTAPQAPGYWTLRLGADTLQLAIAPRRAPSVHDLTGRARAFGVAVQVHGLRFPHDGGSGDLGAAADLAERLAVHGAQALVLSPLHAQFSAVPERFAPYAPSSRLALNPLLADPAAVFPADAVRAGGDDGADLIRWGPAGTARLALLRTLFEQREAHPDIARNFAAFAATAGPDLHRHALFEALHAVMLAQGHGFDWRGWPVPLRDPHSPQVAAFAASRSEEVSFHLFLQWIAARGLETAQARARAAGMGIGLVTDIAVGLDPAGSQAWSRPGDLLAGLSIGAPPDLINTQGQKWGLTAISPTALDATGFAPFLAAIRAALSHAGGVRIDHILGLRRMWLVPDGAPAGEGAYLAYPCADLMRLVALEATTHGALIIGEDLGTVPEGLREAMAARGLLGMRVLPFERDAGGGFLPPAHWQADAVAMTTTHDLATIAGWWRGRDLEWRARIADAPVAPQALAERAAERDAFRAAAAGAGLTAPGADPQQAVDAAIAYVAATPCALAIVPLEDLVGLEESPNLPGTVDEHPNWRRRMPAPAADLLAAPRITARLDLLQRERGQDACPP